ncbi:MAG: phenylalanine--tRNA ligase subunit alpha [Chthoniobacterales bacterium]|jgi:phenylalanyl-tRNA synthetase alpha chain|nr:phenylalanine--tRNA ligase subunit alpha [Chthoniobacterales bacterium]
MREELNTLRAQTLRDIAGATDLSALEHVRVAISGRSGGLTQAGEQMRHLAKEERPEMGKLLHEVRTTVTGALEARMAELRAAAEEAEVAQIDPSLPGVARVTGSLHPLQHLQRRAVEIFRRMGFALAEGPDIETEWHCFDALNTPADHPARNEQDTFYLPDGRLLRTHTSSVQIRTMERETPPVRIIAPGAAYRRDEVDATHLAQFTQMEGLYVDEGVTLGDLKGTLEYFFRELFGPDTKVRFRPHFFPFTEPSYEIDVRAAALGGGERWLELAGCGMVDPAVFEQINARRGDKAFDPGKITGFAFGFGLERLAMILYGVPDIRMFVENDQRFLAQFAS